VGSWTASKTLKVNIEPPIWETKWAYLAYCVLIGIVVFTIGYFALKIQKLAHNVQLEHLNSETAEKINKDKLRFFSNISHEIKTPLTLIEGPVQLLFQRFRNELEIRSILDIVRRQSRKIEGLIDQVHDFQKSEANLLKMNFSVFNLNEFIKEVVVDFPFMAENERKQFYVSKIDKSIYVRADKDKLEKVLNNILNNAFKFTREGDEIHLDCSVSEKNLIMKVKDTGLGIRLDEQPRIFERFYQARGEGKGYSGGSGIGLAFAKRLVDMHYGFISVSGDYGKGSTFEVRLPIVYDIEPDELQELQKELLRQEEEIEMANVKVPSSNHRHIDINPAVKEAKIFFAEDNTEMRSFVFNSLSPYFSVQSFINGKELLNALDKEWPELILSDVLMPEINGFDLCKHIKGDIKTSHIPVILLTACTSVDDKIEGMNLGADLYMTKPFDLQQLVVSIETMLLGRRRLKQRFEVSVPTEFEQTNQADGAFLQKLYSLLSENLDNEEIDINLIAKELYLNRSQFYKKVKVLTNETPFELIKLYRLKKAAEFLTSGLYSVNEVSYKTGFKSRTHFSKIFKKRYGVSPGRYAEKFQKMEQQTN
ncbi:MAG: ATP-binding protein, partial [Bacteroidota bacterium]